LIVPLKGLSLAFHRTYSQPGFEVSLWLRMRFLTVALNTGQCKFIAVSFMKLNLDI